jgi:hypothetical protein
MRRCSREEIPCAKRACREADVDRSALATLDRFIAAVRTSAAAKPRSHLQPRPTGLWRYSGLDRRRVGYLQPKLQPRIWLKARRTKKALLRWEELRGLEPLTPQCQAVMIAFRAVRRVNDGRKLTL